VNRTALWKLSVATSPEAEEAVAELLAREFRQPATAYTNAQTGTTTVTVYFTEKPRFGRRKLVEISGGIRQIRACGLEAGPGRISMARVRRENWAESWKRHFRPIEFGSVLLIKPGWSRRRPRLGQAVVVLDPGLSFGTGRHPTTAFCLQQLVTQRKPGLPHSFLDLGTGSGILAIAAAKLGYAPIHALDTDPQAVRIARANARMNQVSRRIHFAHQDLAKLPLRAPRKYSLICANLTADLLIAHRSRILARLQTGGLLAVAGTLKQEFPQVQSIYEAAGLCLVTSRSRQEWRSAAFARTD
jgi:ribosomal protein L11 methyltransferase